MGLKFWVVLGFSLALAVGIARLASELIVESVIESYVDSSIRKMYDSKASDWRARLLDRSDSVANHVAQLRSESYFEFKLARLDKIESLEYQGLPGIYYFILSPGGAILSLYIDEERVVEVGPVPGTFYLANLNDITVLLVNVLVVIAVFKLMLLLRFRPLEKLLYSGGELETKGSENSIDLVEDLSDEISSLRSKIVLLQQNTEQKIENQRDFLHGVAHEFRAPLARLRFALHIESDDRDEIIESIVESMDGLVTEILQYSRYRHGLFALEYTEIDIGKLFDNLVTELDLNESITITRGKGLDQLLRLQTDENLIKRCLYNIVHNALSFAKKEILIDIQVNNRGQVCLIVEDDGPGVPPGKRKFVFEPFTRLDPSRSRASGGTGLGLAIAEGILDKLGGEVEISDPLFLTGARVVIKLPA